MLFTTWQVERCQDTQIQTLYCTCVASIRACTHGRVAVAPLRLLTFGLRPRLPFTFLGGLTGFLLFECSAGLSGTVAWLSTFTRLPLFLDRSSGWIRGRTPPFEMVTPRRSWRRPDTQGETMKEKKKRVRVSPTSCSPTASVGSRQSFPTHVTALEFYRQRIPSSGSPQGPQTTMCKK